MWKHSVFFKLLLGNLLLIALLVIVGGLVAYHQLDRNYLDEGRLNQRRTVDLLADYMEHIWPEASGQIGSIDPICKRLLADSPMRLTVIAADGRVLGDSQTDPRKMENHDTPSRAEVAVALKGLSGHAERPSETLGIPFRYIAKPIFQNGKVAGVVRVAMPIHVISVEETLIRNGLLLAGAAAAAAAGILALLLSWIWYAPLRQIARTAKTLAGGNLSHRAAVAGSDELSQLASALNEMRDSIASQINQIAAQRQNLVSVVDNLREGVLGLDRDGRILLANQSAIDLLAGGLEGPVINQHLQLVVRVPDVVDAYDAAVRTGQSVSRNVELFSGGKWIALDIHARSLQSGDAGRISGILVVRDVTEMARSAAMKAEFVANASHELRTPLATIRAAVDSLAFGGTEDPAAFAKCLAILNRHISRLENMTNDLLDLNIAETGRAKLRQEDIPVGSLGAWAESHFATQALEKLVELSVETQRGELTFRSDRRLLDLIVQNIVHNAIKYTPAGGRVECLIAMSPETGRLTIRVTDTGCGIRPQDKPRIFERFFQADPARSGDSNVRGTGLGLAIVKHACERLGARITIDSEVGHGTCVTVHVPASNEEQ
jgi:two-component system phosphate regulon sensor histidine kinase PhoR